jgi:hypothetical protein
VLGEGGGVVIEEVWCLVIEEVWCLVIEEVWCWCVVFGD